MYNMIYKSWFCAVGVTCRRLGLLTRFACMSKNNFNKLKHMWTIWTFSKTFAPSVLCQTRSWCAFPLSRNFCGLVFFWFFLWQSFRKNKFSHFFTHSTWRLVWFWFSRLQHVYFNTSSNYHLGFWTLEAANFGQYEMIIGKTKCS